MSKSDYPHTVIAEEINDNSNKDEKYEWNVNLIYPDVIKIQAISITTGVEYILNLGKNKEWCKNNLIKLQNDFSQLYQVLDEAVCKRDGLFYYTVNEVNDNLKLIIKTNPETKFFKLELEIDIPRFISEHGLTAERIKCVEYQLNRLKEDFKTLQKPTFISSHTQTETQTTTETQPGSIQKKIYNECGNLVYSGEMKNGKRDGNGIQYCPDSGQIIYEGQFKDGYYDGEGVLYGQSAGITTYNFMYCCYYKGTFKKGLFHDTVNCFTTKPCRDPEESVRSPLVETSTHYRCNEAIYKHGMRYSQKNWDLDNDLNQPGREIIEIVNLVPKNEIISNNQAIQDEN